jgi:hypothetical protein
MSWNLSVLYWSVIPEVIMWGLSVLHLGPLSVQISALTSLLMMEAFRWFPYFVWPDSGGYQATHILSKWTFRGHVLQRQPWWFCITLWERLILYRHWCCVSYCELYVVYFYTIEVPAAIAVDYWFNCADVCLQRVSVHIHVIQDVPLEMQR